MLSNPFTPLLGKNEQRQSAVGALGGTCGAGLERAGHSGNRRVNPPLTARH